ncbi:MAG: MASE1 domain-containing protein [bacterium]
MTTDTGSLPTLGRGMRFAVIALFTAAYYLSARFGLMLAEVQPNATIVWPCTGISLAAVLILGRWVWPAIFAGAFLANFSTAGTAWTSVAIAAGNTLEALAGGWLVNRFSGGVRAFDSPRQIVTYAAVTALFSTTISATIGVVSLQLGGFVSASQFTPAWLAWWVGDMISDLVVAPFIILWFTKPRIQWSVFNRYEALLLLLLLITIGQCVFSGWLPFENKDYPLEFVCLPLLVWAAFRFGPCETATASLVLSAIAFSGTYRDLGPFAQFSPHESFILLQTYLGGSAVIALIMAAAVSEQRRAEEALRDSEAQTRAILNTTVDAIITIDERGSVLSFNPAAERIFGYAANEVQGRNVAMLMPPPHRDRHDAYISNYLQTGVAKVIGISREETGRRKDGSVFDLDLAVSEVWFGPRRIFTGIIRDITSHKKAEQRLMQMADELERSNKDLEQFAFIASHDLQEPLRKVRSFTEMLARRYQGRLDADADTFIEYIVDGAKRLQLLIDDLLLYSRVGRGELVVDPVAVGDIVLAVTRDMERHIKEDGGEIHVGDLPVVHANATLLRQVFQNLVGNAAKFRSDTPLRIRIWSERTDGRWLFAVSDNGIGIAPEAHDRIFLAFQRLHTRREYPGTGMGLAICKRIVERHAGKIRVESEPERGATFFFTIPDRDAAPFAEVQSVSCTAVAESQTEHACRETTE